MVDRIHDLKVNLGIYYRTNTWSHINLFLLTHPSVIKPNLTRGIKGKEKKANKTLWIVILNFVTPSTTAPELINATIILQKTFGWMWDVKFFVTVQKSYLCTYTSHPNDHFG